MLSFGLLALSRTQALRAIGLTVGIGTALSFLLAPLTLTIMRGEWQRQDGHDAKDGDAR
jgi:predicted exporter